MVYASERDHDVALLGAPGESFVKRFRAKKVILKPGIYGRGGLREEGRRPLTLLMGMTVLVLLIACANVANLQPGGAARREIVERLPGRRVRICLYRSQRRAILFCRITMS